MPWAACCWPRYGPGRYGEPMGMAGRLSGCGRLLQQPQQMQVGRGVILTPIARRLPACIKRLSKSKRG